MTAERRIRDRNHLAKTGQTFYNGGVEGSQLISDIKRLTESLGKLPEPVVRSTFIVVSGLPGTGKTYFCSKLAERLRFVVLESDALRKTLFPAPGYSPEESARLFRVLHHLIEGLLERGTSLILDATNLSERSRERLYSIAERADVRLVLVRVEAPPEVVYQRLKSRVAGANTREKSDADWSVYQRMKPAVERIRRNHYAVDTSRDIAPVLDKIVREVSR